MPDDTETGFNDTETIEEDTGISSGSEGLEAKLYQDYKFQPLMFEGVLNTVEIVRKGFRIDGNFAEEVVNDELLFASLPPAEKRKNKLQSHKDLDKIFPDTEEGRINKGKEKELLLENFIKQNSVGSKPSKDDLFMFENTFELAKKAWKKQGGFSREDFLRFATNMAKDPDTIKQYQGWFETIFSAAAMLCWEAIRLRKNPETFAIEKIEVTKEGKETSAAGEAQEKGKGIALSPQVKLAAVGVISGLLVAGIVYFMILTLLQSDHGIKKSLGAASSPEIKQFSHLCGKTWARNPQNNLALLLKKKKARIKKNEIETKDKKIYYPVIQGTYEAYLDFRDRVKKETRALRECGYKVIEIKGSEAELVAREKKYQEILDTCLSRSRTEKTAPSPLSAGGS